MTKKERAVGYCPFLPIWRWSWIWLCTIVCAQTCSLTNFR